MNEKSGVIYRTDNYKQFKRLDGNRAIRAKSVEKIKKSIERVGYVMSPICVNEKYEIIDGQYRSHALEELGKPIDYYVVNGAGINECRSMNIDQGNWTIRDFIASYTELGEMPYVYLSQLLKAYKCLGLAPVVYAATGIQRADGIIKTGELKLTTKDYENAVKILDLLMKLHPIIQKQDGRRESYYTALIYCFRHPEIDNETLINKMNLRQYDLVPPANVPQALKSIESAYNYRSRNKVYIEADYRRDQDMRETESMKVTKRKQRAKKEAK